MCRDGSHHNGEGIRVDIGGYFEAKICGAFAGDLDGDFRNAIIHSPRGS